MQRNKILTTHLYWNCKKVHNFIICL